jgi:uncharacterized membrane-anchored protein
LIPINQTQEPTTLLMTEKAREATLYGNRAGWLGMIVGAITMFVTALIAIVLGTTGIFTTSGAVTLGLFGGFIGGTAIGLITGLTYYVSRMWTSFAWADPGSESSRTCP